MSQQSPHIHARAWRGIRELLRPYAGNDEGADGQDAVENRPGIGQVVVGGTGRCVHGGIVPT